MSACACSKQASGRLQAPICAYSPADVEASPNLELALDSMEFLSPARSRAKSPFILTDANCCAPLMMMNDWCCQRVWSQNRDEFFRPWNESWSARDWTHSHGSCACCRGARAAASISSARTHTHTHASAAARVLARSSALISDSSQTLLAFNLHQISCQLRAAGPHAARRRPQTGRVPPRGQNTASERDPDE